MSGDTVVFDERAQVYRISTETGALLGTEYGGHPLAFDDARSATDMIERRAELADIRHARGARQ